MADDIRTLTALAAASSDDILYIVDAPGGTAVDRKITVAALQASTQGGVAYTWPGSAGTNGYVLTTNGSGTLSWTQVSSGSGTVTSVAMTVPTGLLVSGSPITSSGTLGVTLDTGYAIPLSADTGKGVTAYGWGNHAGLYDAAGTASGLIGTHESTYNHSNYNDAYSWGNHASAGYLTSLAMDGLSDVAITTQALGDIVYASAGSAWVNLAGNTTATKKFLRQTGNGSISAAPAWDTVTATDVGLGSVENTALSTWAGSTNIVTVGTIGTGTWNATTIATTKGGTNLTGYATGDILYASATNTLAALAGPTAATNKFLRSVGTGAAAQAPSWESLIASDIPDLSATYATSGHNHSGVYEPADAFLTDIANLTDPNADRLLFWDDSAGDIVWLTLGTGLSITDTTISATASGGAWTHATTYTTLDNAGDNVGINAGASPAAKLHVVATTEQLRLGYDASNYASWTVSSAGVLAITATSHVSVKGLYIAQPAATSNIYISPDTPPAWTGTTNSIAIGDNAAAALAGGDDNLFIGTDAGKSISTGYEFVALGTYAAKAVRSDSAASVVIGSWACDNNAGGLLEYAVIIGGSAARAGRPSNGVIIGHLAGGSLTGSGTVLIGKSIGTTLTSSDFTIGVGYAPTFPGAVTDDYQLVLGALDNRAIWSADYRVGINVGGPANGQGLGIKTATTTLSAMSGATVTATNLIPAGSTVLGVTIRVTTLITGATTFDVGDGTDVDRWGAAIAVAANTTTTGTAFTVTTPNHYTAATSVVLTANGGNFSAGAVRVTVHYLDFTAATS